MAGKIDVQVPEFSSGLAPWLRPAILALAAVLLLACFSTEVADSDTWLHLETGKYVVEHHRIPNPDPVQLHDVPGQSAARRRNCPRLQPDALVAGADDHLPGVRRRRIRRHGAAARLC